MQRGGKIRGQTVESQIFEGDGRWLGKDGSGNGNVCVPGQLSGPGKMISKRDIIRLAGSNAEKRRGQRNGAWAKPSEKNPENSHIKCFCLPKTRLLGNFFQVAFTGSSLFFCIMSRRFATHWLPLLFWMSAIFSASTKLGSPENTSRFLVPFLLWLDPHMSWQTIEHVHLCVRKTAHALEYAVLGFLIWRVVHSAAVLAAQRTPWHFRLSLLLAALYAATDETHQIFVPGREARVLDVLLDTCGAGFGLAATWGFLRMRKQK
jgi:VanZ family protein